ncbi:unnamed protein product [Rangifer tarandus platyrhynchus]|uniref:Uncharacterized protein n=1 Tax=Rangifer tarandus platyrhynchus TaxID=3082113 RepID=A0ABN9A206_RANTA|nr:unnamed protein product [Rangifer tarandus platyrhynchus]
MTHSAPGTGHQTHKRAPSLTPGPLLTINNTSPPTAARLMRRDGGVRNPIFVASWPPASPCPSSPAWEEMRWLAGHSHGPKGVKAGMGAVPSVTQAQQVSRNARKQGNVLFP